MDWFRKLFSPSSSINVQNVSGSTINIVNQSPNVQPSVAGSSSGGLAMDVQQQLYVILSERLNLSDLKTGCFMVGVDWEELSGENKSDKITSLLLHLSRHQQLSQFVAWLREQRPDIRNLPVVD